MEKADSTLRTSQAVPHPSTIRALSCLTSEVGRDPVHSTRYGRQRKLSPTSDFGGLGGPTPFDRLAPLAWQRGRARTPITVAILAQGTH